MLSYIKIFNGYLKKIPPYITIILDLVQKDILMSDSAEL